MSSQCRPQLTWEVLYAHHDGGSSGALDWQTIAKGVTGSAFMSNRSAALRLRLRVRPRPQGSHRPVPGRAPRATNNLPRAPTGAKRLELKLTAQLSSDLPASGYRRTSRPTFSPPLSTSQRRGSTSPRRLFFIFDVLEATPDSGPDASLWMSSSRASKQVYDQRSALFAGSVTRGVDPAAPPLISRAMAPCYHWKRAHPRRQRR